MTPRPPQPQPRIDRAREATHPADRLKCQSPPCWAGFGETRDGPLRLNFAQVGTVALMHPYGDKSRTSWRNSDEDSCHRCHPEAGCWRCLRSRQCRSHRDVRGWKRVASAEIGKLFCGSAWIRDRERQYWFNGYQYPPRFRRSGLPDEQRQRDDHVASPGRCSAGGYDTKINQLAPAARSRKGRRVLVARPDASKRLCRFGSAGGRFL
jgi:hypothetical protein